MARRNPSPQYRYEHYDPMPRYTIPRVAHCEGGALAVFGIAAVVAFAVALILQLASVSKGVVLTVTTFMLIGFICLSLHLLGLLPLRRGT